MVCEYFRRFFRVTAIIYEAVAGTNSPKQKPFCQLESGWPFFIDLINKVFQLAELLFTGCFPVFHTLCVLKRLLSVKIPGKWHTFKRLCSLYHFTMIKALRVKGKKFDSSLLGLLLPENLVLW